MKKYVIANWKSHKTSDSARQWLDKFIQNYRHSQETEIIVSPSMVSLEPMSEYIEGLGQTYLSVAAQDVSPYPIGSYTGAVAADLLKPSAKYVIIGHSERKRYFHETVQDVANKLSEVVDCGLIPIVCVESVQAISQLTTLVDQEISQLVIAYTPVDALNFAIAESVEMVSEAVTEIEQITPGYPVVYGGAIHQDNARNYFDLENLSGLFVGSASLDVESFVKICSCV